MRGGLAFAQLDRMIDVLSDSWWRLLSDGA